MEAEMSFYPLLIVISLAFLVPIVLSRFKQIKLPIVVGEIIVGIIIGRSGFGWVGHEDEILTLLSELGFVFLMFLSGMEIDFSSLGFDSSGRQSEDQPRSPVTISAITFVLTLILSLLVGFGLVWMGLVDSPWMIALILSTTSLGVVVPVLKEQGLSQGRYGQTILISSLIADFMTMILITVLVTALSKGLTFDILLIGLLFVAFFLFYYFGERFFNKEGVVRRVMNEISQATAQIKVRAAFTMMLIFVALAEMLGTEIILGAFLGGAVLSLLSTPEDEELLHRLDAMGYGFFIPIFFIMVGVDFNLASLLSSSQALLLLPLLLTAAAAVKFIPALAYKLNYDWKKTLGAGAILSARLSLIIAASAIGLRLGVISEPVNATIILIAILTVILSPFLFTRLVPWEEIKVQVPIVIVGSGEVGTQVAEYLLSHNQPVVLIEHSSNRVMRGIERGFDVIHARCDQYDPKSEEHLNQAERLVCVYSDVDRNYRVCERARHTYGIVHVVSRVSAPGEMSRFEKIGVTAVNPATDLPMLLGLLTRNPSLYELLTRAEANREVCEITVRNRGYLNKPLRDLDLPGDLVIMAVRKDEELIVPRGDTRLNRGDKLTVLGPGDCVENTRRLFSG
ncbi:MAG: monovalent cation:proton antiporter family protein [Anaerolineales bacterium]